MSHLAWYFFAIAYASLGKFGHLRVRSLVWEAREFVLVQVKYVGYIFTSDWKDDVDMQRQLRTFYMHT